MNRYFPAVVSLLLSSISPLLAQPEWMDDLQRFGSAITVGAPRGVEVASAPGAAPDPSLAQARPGTVNAVGFVEREGVRYYLTVKGNDELWETGKVSHWVLVPDAVLPEKPPMTSSRRGTDPNTGDEVTIESYEETVPLEETTEWPLEDPEFPDVVLPVKVVSAEATGDGSWRAVLTVYPNFDSNVEKFGFIQPSFQQLSDPAFQVLRQLTSRPSRKEITVTGTANGERMAAVLKPGVVFNGRFHQGQLYYLEAGDTWPPIVAASRLSAPQFQDLSGVKSFRFHISTLDGGHALFEVQPDKITGADYTHYEGIAKMGPPFDEQTGMDEWLMEEWSIEIHCDQTVHIVAPLMEGRGAPGMLELESLALDDSPYDREVAALKDFLEVQPPALAPAAGWTSILERPLGPVAEQQRGEETTPW